MRSSGILGVVLGQVFALAACSKGSPPPSIGELVVPGSNAISAWRPTELPFLTLLDQPAEMLECWRRLEEKLEIAYQVFVPPQSSYAILVGDLPRERVEACVAESLLFHMLLEDEELERDGELTVAKTKLGTVYAAWHHGRIIVGPRQHVTTAIAARETVSAPAWLRPDDLPTPDALANISFAAVSTDAMFGNVLGVPTTRWKLVFESPRQPWPERELLKDSADALERFGRDEARRAEREKQGLPPEEPPPAPAKKEPTFTGRLELTYATPEAANQLAAEIAKGTFAIPLEENLAVAIMNLPREVSGDTLTLRFDQGSFAGVELAKLQAWLASLQALPPAGTAAE